MGIVIAIDGPSGAGKSTIARRLAEKLGFTYIDTGAMYRAVALWASRQGVAVNDMHRIEQLGRAASIELEPASSRVWLNGEDVTEAIRTPDISSAASAVAVIPGLRRALVDKQREMGARANVVMEGRDIGSVVFPDAQVKIFLDADESERARRRFRELEAKGQAPPPAEMVRQMRERDQRDRSRREAPLTQAPDAVYVDTSSLNLDQVEEELLKLVRTRITNGKEFGT